MMIIDTNRKTKESVVTYLAHVVRRDMLLTKDKFFGGRKHVQGKCDFILVALELKPANG